ncbi:MAG: hypothetical protein QM233_04665 [Candidatus Cloacimonadota bacterium]|jgi:tetrahydromethanopterin S-methyltransferase subunit E|nr:hypothetical protein [Candidatus Cloacimonadota bacterium]
MEKDLAGRSFTKPTYFIYGAVAGGVSYLLVRFSGLPPVLIIYLGSLLFMSVFAFEVYLIEILHTRSVIPMPETYPLYKDLDVSIDNLSIGPPVWDELPISAVRAGNH